MGFTSLVVQTLLIREFLVTFYGNELTIGLILGIWILSQAFASAASSGFGNKRQDAYLNYTFLQLFISIYLPISIFLTRVVKNFLAITPGEAVGLLPIFFSSLLIVAPLGIFIGMQFPCGCNIYEKNSKNPGQTAGRVYILEAAGFILAGPILTYIFLTRADSFQIVFLIGLINLISGLFLSGEKNRSFPKKIIAAGISVLAVLNLCLIFSGVPLKIHKYSLLKQWRNQKLIEYKNSIYGNLVVSQKQEQYTFYANGIPVINIPTPDIISTEDLIHFGLLSHPDPKKILFLSGGAGGPINEVLKHPVEKIDYAELDPLLIDLIKKFPRAITEKELSDHRLNLKITDGVRFIKTTSSKYDVVFINLPPPSTLQLNRYYTKEFFNRIKEILNPGGKLVLALPGSLSYLNEELKELNLCVLNILKEVFPYVEVIPGDNNLYISSCVPMEITPEVFLERIRQRNISTNVLTPSYLEYRLKTSWRDWLYENLKKSSGIKENSNLTPCGVFYGIAYWNSLFTPYLRGFFSAINKINFNHLIFFIIILEIILFFLKTLVPKFKKIGVAMSMATTGFAGMSFYLIFIFSYQVFFGYVYHHIALLATSFMAGLAGGSWLVTKNSGRIKNNLAWFISMEISIVLFSLASGLFLVYLNGIGEFGFYPLFYILSALSGFFVGAEFPLANKLYRQDNTYVKTAGLLYAADLFGSFFAALPVSIVLLPMFGVLKTCIFLAMLKAGGLILFFKQN